MRHLKRCYKAAIKCPMRKRRWCSDKGENSLGDNYDNIHEKNSYEQCGAKLVEIGMNKEPMGPV